MHKPTISVVIPNWNGKAVIADCLRSLQKQTFRPLEIIVVENGSKDGSLEFIKKSFTKVVLVEEPKNLGFAGGVNAGIKVAKGDYIWVFNNDATAEPNCLERLVQTANTTQADIVSAVILTNNDTKIDSDGDVYTIYGLPFPRHRGLDVSHIPKADEAIFAASGGASLYKKALFDEIGLFDEVFFAYYEDVDLSMRAQLMGKKIVLSHGAIVHHVMGHTSNKIPGFGREMAIRNSIYIFWKDLPFSILLKVFPKFLYANWRLTAAAMVKGHPLRAVRAHFVALAYTPWLLAKRHNIQHSRTVSAREFGDQLSTENPFEVLKGRQ